jgi:hypothetical protein
MSGGECVAGLVRVTVSNASFFEVGTHAFLRIASAFAQGSPVLGSLKINSLFMKVNCFCACSAASASLFNSALRVPALFWYLSERQQHWPPERELF